MVIVRIGFVGLMIWGSVVVAIGLFGLVVAIPWGASSKRSWHDTEAKTEFHTVRATGPARLDLATIRQTIAATHNLLRLLQPQLEDKARRKLRRLTQRLLNIDHELDDLTPK